MQSICALLLCQINLILLLSPFNSFHCEFRVSTQIIALQNKQGLLMASWATFFMIQNISVNLNPECSHMV